MTIISTRRFALTLAIATTISLSPLPALGAATSIVAPDSKTTIQLGDLDKLVNAQTVGAPFDPCGIGWAAFPVEVRPQPETKPKIKVPADDDVFATGCRFDNGDKTTVSTDQGASPQLGRNFITLVVWGQDGKMSAAVTDHKDAKPATFGSKQGLIKSGTSNSSKEPTCTAIVKLANGVVGVSITNGRFQTPDTCAIATHVANHIAQTTP